MNKIFIFVGCFFCLLSNSIQAQKKSKELAIVSIYADKQLLANDFIGINENSVILKLMKDPAFNLDTVVFDLQKELYGELAQALPFDLKPINDVINAPGYKDVLTGSGNVFEDFEVTKPNGYIPIPDQGGFKNINAIKKSFEVFPTTDYIMVAFIDFSLIKDKENSAKVMGFLNIHIYSKDVAAGHKVLVLRENESSDHSFKYKGKEDLNGALILSLCKEATVKLYKDALRDLPKKVAHMKKSKK